MKVSLLLLIISSAALAQGPEKMITFNRANTEHCKVGFAGGKPLLESTYEGTTVAIGMPMNRGNGEFAVFVVVSRVDPGTIKVNPKDFYGLFSDPSHSRFTFVDKAAELQWQGGPQPPSSGNPNGNAQATVEALAASIAGPPLGGGGQPPGGPDRQRSSGRAAIRIEKRSVGIGLASTIFAQRKGATGGQNLWLGNIPSGKGGETRSPCHRYA